MAIQVDFEPIERRVGVEPDTTLSFSHGTELINEILVDQLTDGRRPHPVGSLAMDRRERRTPLMPPRGNKRAAGGPPDGRVAVPATPARPGS